MNIHETCQLKDTPTKIIKSDKTNYRPVSILPNHSKIYEKLIYNQLYYYFDEILLPSQCGFCKGYSSHHCLLAMLQNFKNLIA